MHAELLLFFFFLLCSSTQPFSVARAIFCLISVSIQTLNHAVYIHNKRIYVFRDRFLRLHVRGILQTESVSSQWRSVRLLQMPKDLRAEKDSRPSFEIRLRANSEISLSALPQKV